MHLPPVLHVDSERGFGGGEVQVFLLMDGLRALGWPQTLACPPRSAAAGRARALGFAVCEIPMRADLDLPAVGRLRAAIRRTRAGLVHLHTGRAAWLGGLAALGSGARVLTTRRMDRQLRRDPRSRLVYGPLVDAVVAISPAVARRLRDGGVRPDKLRTIWSAVDPDRLRPAAGRGATRAALGAEAGTTVVLAAAKLVPNKGLDLLLHAFASPGIDRRAALWIAGAGPEAGRLAARAGAADLAGRVRLLGHRDDIADLLLGCDLFAMTSHTEGLGVAALEAMALGRPVLATRVGGLADAVVDGETGLLAAPGDVASIAAGLGRLVADADLRARLGEAGRRRIAAEFVPGRMVAAYDALYRELLAASR